MMLKMDEINITFHLFFLLKIHIYPGILFMITSPLPPHKLC